MSTTLLPEVSCNAQCTGCYMGATFVRIGKGPRYDIDAMLASAAQGPQGEAALHGGEVSLLPTKDLKRFLDGLLAQGRPSVVLQTNALTLSEEKMLLIAAYNDEAHPARVSVGVSLNGPTAMNRDRRFGSVEQTDKASLRIYRNLERLRALNVDVGVITVLSRTNAGTPELVEELIGWAKGLGERLGIWSFRFNPLGYHAEHDVVSGAEMTCLSEAEAARVWVRLAEETMRDPRHTWLPFREFLDNLWGLGVQPCWVKGCDPYDTEAVYGINPDGALSNCGRTAVVDGILYGRDGQADDLRDQVLQAVPYPDGGCGGCKWFPVCHGGCPGEAIAGDWRNRSQFCGAYIAVYEFLDRGMKGWLPNFIGRQDWKNVDQQAINEKNPPISPIWSTFPATSREPSTWTQASRSTR